MDARRPKFYLALALYLGWILALGVLALTSGNPPRPRISQSSAK